MNSIIYYFLSNAWNKWLHTSKAKPSGRQAYTPISIPTRNPAQPGLSLPAKGEGGKGDAGASEGKECGGETEGEMITCCLCMCPIPVLFLGAAGIRGGIDVAGQMERGTGGGTKNCEAYAMGNE